MSDLNIKKVDLKDLNEAVKKYEYALLYYPGETVLDKVTNFEEVELDKVLEAYFFDANGQIHINDNGIEKNAVEFSHRDSNYIEKKYLLATKYSEIGKEVIVHEYLNSDEDGQSYVEYTALSGIR